jgi:benzylsuccinate CoA-transferase BbsF subunit
MSRRGRPPRVDGRDGRASGDELPLTGVRVLDFTTTLAGPSATRQMADFGAEVIKVESSRRMDTARLGHPFRGGVPALDRSGYFAAYNAGKSSLVLDLRVPAAIEIVRRLTALSDVLIESFRPGVMEAFGITPGVVREWNPRIVMVSHSLQGQTGPRSRQRGYGQLASAMTGWVDMTGEPGEEPVGPYSAYTDFIAAPLLLSAVLLALEHRDATGEGQHVDQSHVASSAYFAAPELVNAQLGEPPRRSGNRRSHVCPNGAFPCRGEDRWCALSVESDDQWAAASAVLGLPDAIAALRGLPARRRREDEIELAIAERTRSRDAHELADELCGAGVPAGAVARAEDLFSDEQLRHRGAFRRLDHPELGEHAVLAAPYRIDGVASGPHAPFPSFGADTLRVCRDVLGMSDDEIAASHAAGAFE